MGGISAIFGLRAIQPGLKPRRAARSAAYPQFAPRLASSLKTSRPSLAWPTFQTANRLRICRTSMMPTKTA